MLKKAKSREQYDETYASFVEWLEVKQLPRVIQYLNSEWHRDRELWSDAW